MRSPYQLSGSLTYDPDNSKVVVGAIIRCYHCCCVITTLGQEYPTKHVNSINVSATPKFLKELREKERYYGQAFGVIPNSEKEALFKALLQENYDAFDIKPDEPPTELHLFLPCFLKLCSTKKSRRLVRYQGWTQDEVKDYHTMQLLMSSGSGLGSASESYLISHIGTKRLPLKQNRIMICLKHNGKVFSRHFIGENDFYPDPGTCIESIVKQQLKYHGTSTPDPIEVLGISHETWNDIVVHIGICGVVET